METTDLKEFLDENPHVCKGIVCRASVSTGVFRQKSNRIGIFEKTQLNVLRRKSCPGCKKCMGLWDQLSEINSDWPVEGLNNAEDGELYQLLIKVTSKDFETGYPDEWNFYITKIDE